MASGYGLALEFDSDDPEFARGVELGRLWALASIEAGQEPEELDGMTLHWENAEMVLRVLAALELEYRAEQVSDDYFLLRRT